MWYECMLLEIIRVVPRDHMHETCVVSKFMVTYIYIN